jgi:hypothetical protein
MKAQERRDDAFEALADQTRRRLLLALSREVETEGRSGSSGGLPVVEPLAALAPAADRERAVRTALYHVHLPKLSEMGFVSWDRENGTVAPGPRWEELEPLLGAAGRAGEPRSR